MILKGLLKENSKAMATGILELIKNQPMLIHELLDLLDSKDISLIQRAAWPLGLLGNDHAHLLSDHIPTMIALLEKPKHNALARNIYRVLQFCEIPEVYQGVLFELCARDLMDPKKPVAIKIFCMTVAFNISQQHADLKPELKLLIEAGFEGGSAGYKSRSRKILKQL